MQVDCDNLGIHFLPYINTYKIPAIAPTAIGTYSKALSMARKMNCSSNPLGSFPFSEFNISGTNKQKLEHIANTPTLSQERSFGGGVVEKLNKLRKSGSSLFNALRQGANNDWIDFTDDPTFTDDYVIFGGTNRSVVIYSYEITLGINPHLQCTQSAGSAFRYALKKTASTDAEDICAACDSGTSVLHTNSSFFKRCEVQGVCRG